MTSSSTAARGRAAMVLLFPLALGACVEKHWDDDDDWPPSWDEPDAASCGCENPGRPDAGARPDAAAAPDATAPECPVIPGAIYVSHDPNLCALLEFSCAEGLAAFTGACGCGCVPTSPPPPPPPTCPEEGPGVWYLSHDGALCASIQFTCPEGQEGFSADCGCGCVDSAGSDAGTSQPDASTSPPDAGTSPPDAGGGGAPDAEPSGCDAGAVCPDRSNPDVIYLGDSPAVCAVITFECPEGCVEFTSPCGCGCIEVR